MNDLKQQILDTMKKRGELQVICVRDYDQAEGRENIILNHVNSDIDKLNKLIASKKKDIQ